MKINSRATNLRHLQDALAAVNALAAPLPGGTPPPLAEADLIRAAARALAVGATERELLAAAGRDRAWVATVRCAATRAPRTTGVTWDQS